MDIIIIGIFVVLLGIYFHRAINAVDDRVVELLNELNDFRKEWDRVHPPLDSADDL